MSENTHTNSIISLYLYEFVVEKCLHALIAWIICKMCEFVPHKERNTSEVDKCKKLLCYGEDSVAGQVNAMR